MPNHIAVNLATKGLLNISNITKGMILINFVVIFKRRGGGGGYATPPLYYDSKEPLFRKIEEQGDDIESIKVYVDWNKSVTANYKMEAVLLKTQIEAEILNETGKVINVEII